MSGWLPCVNPFQLHLATPVTSFLFRFAMFTAVRSRKQTECSVFITVKLTEVGTIVKDQKNLLKHTSLSVGMLRWYPICRAGTRQKLTLTATPIFILILPQTDPVVQGNLF